VPLGTPDTPGAFWRGWNADAFPDSGYW